MTQIHKNESPVSAGQFVKKLYSRAADFIAETLAILNDSEFPRYWVFALLVLGVALIFGSCNGL
jgi:hypothetical protein